MSYITAERLAERIQQMLGEPSIPVSVSDTRTHVRFRAWIGERVVDFRIPEDVLHNAPMTYVSEKYLRPLLDSHKTEPL